MVGTLTTGCVFFFRMARRRRAVSICAQSGKAKDTRAAGVKENHGFVNQMRILPTIQKYVASTLQTLDCKGIYCCRSGIFGTGICIKFTKNEVCSSGTRGKL